MATTRHLPTATPTAPTAPQGSARHRLRAVHGDEGRALPRPAADARPHDVVAELLPPGATWFPAPQEALPSLPGRPPMIGYLVLVPADRQPAFPPHATADRPDGPAADGPADHGGALVRVDPVGRTAEVGGRPLDLTYLEFELLAHLVAHPHRVHTRDHLVTTVWGYGHVGDGRTVDVHIARLRRKLGAEHRAAIQTVRRVGYKYVPPTGR
ncbi:winged helix-turn-helix domain-containing protein [Streptomyces sp. NPDC007264]|uniref:winged helix-turn-helix domain-containing protein n=1 Tax=Streptomyces sp. NPDC007264 TaxID=3364777 RepID=UPI0036D8D533